MKRLYDFKCSSCSHEFEEYMEYAKFCICPSCGMSADKVISTPHIKLEGITGSFPSASWAWEKRHAEKLKQEQKQNG